MALSNEFAWTTGEDADVSHHNPIGGGGFGEVHEVMTNGGVTHL